MAAQGSIKQKKAALEELAAKITNEQQDPLPELRRLLNEVAVYTENLDYLRQSYIASNAAEPAGAIKDPVGCIILEQPGDGDLPLAVIISIPAHYDLNRHPTFNQ